MKIRIEKDWKRKTSERTVETYAAGVVYNVDAETAIEAAQKGYTKDIAAVAALKVVGGEVDQAPALSSMKKDELIAELKEWRDGPTELQSAKFDEIEKENTALKAQLEEATTELERQRDAAETGEGDLANKVKELETENAQQAELLAEAQTAIETLTTERDAAAKELSDLKAASA